MSYKAALEREGVEIRPGLTLREIQVAEAVCETQFPDDLKDCLAAFVPFGSGFPNWRQPDCTRLADQLAWPLAGILFDIERNGFWFDAWGSPPSSVRVALDVASVAIAKAPRLIPLRGHRYLPALPRESGNPVFSVYQTDVINYGENLADYFDNEYGSTDSRSASGPSAKTKRSIEFWSALELLNR